MIRRMLLRLVLALALLPAVAPAPAFAWGSTGHKLITRMALANTTPRTRAEIARLLAAEAQLGTAACRLENLEDASIWPDCLRAERWRWAYTYPWHYQDAAICAAAYDPRANCENGNCVSAQIERARRILADRTLPDAQRLEALAFLVHLVEDIHQPLHVAELDHNFGGNSISVTNYPKAPIIQPAKPRPIVIREEPQPLSLHWFWDETLVVALVDKEGDAGMVRRYDAAERARIATGGPADWAGESWQLAKTVVYPQAFGHDPCAGGNPRAIEMSGAQVAADLPVVRERLVQAGLRLANMLDEALGS